MLYFTAILILVGFTGSVYATGTTEPDNITAYDHAEHVVIGKIISAKVMATTGTSEHPSGKMVYEIDIEESFKKQSEKKILMAWVPHDKNSDLPEYPLYKVGDRVFLYLHIPSDDMLYQIIFSESTVLGDDTSVCPNETYYDRGICIKKETGASLVADIDPYEKQFRPSFQFSRTMIVEYGNDGIFHDAITGNDTRIHFSDNSSNPHVADLMQKMNQNLRDSHSPSRVTELELVFDGHVKGHNLNVFVEHIVTLTPTMTGHIADYTQPEEPVTIDASWRGIQVLEPVIITTSDDRTLDINNPMSLIGQTQPLLYDALDATPAKNRLSMPMIDSSHLSEIPLTDWAYTFAPWSSEQGRTPIVPTGWDGWNVSAFQLGSFSLREEGNEKGIFETEIVLDKTYPVRILENMDRAFLKTKGFASVDIVNGDETLTTSSKPPATGPIEGKDQEWMPFLMIGIVVALLVAAAYYLGIVRR